VLIWHTLLIRSIDDGSWMLIWHTLLIRSIDDGSWIWHTLLIDRCSIVMHVDDPAWLADQSGNQSCIMIWLAMLSDLCRSCMLHADLAYLVDRPMFDRHAR
jgi:hypothetical protein